MDILLLAVLDKVVALQHGVTLDLVGSGNDTGAVDEGLELFGLTSVRLQEIQFKWRLDERAQ